MEADEVWHGTLDARSLAHPPKGDVGAHPSDHPSASTETTWTEDGGVDEGGTRRHRSPTPSRSLPTSRVRTSPTPITGLPSDKTYVEGSATDGATFQRPLVRLRQRHRRPDVDEVTIGTENADGTLGQALVNAGDASTVLKDGLVVCATYSEPATEGASFTYQVTVDTSTSATDLVNEAVHTTSDPGAKPASTSAHGDGRRAPRIAAT